MKTGIWVSIALLLVWAINATSEAVDKHFDEARELMNSGNYQEAAKEFDAVVKLLQDDSEVVQNARYWVGQCYFRMREFDQALSTFEKLIQDYPESSIIPVTQLMMTRVEQEKENEKLRPRNDDLSDSGIIVDPETGLKYTRIRTLTGKSDVLTHGKLSPNGKFMLSGKLVVPLDEGEPFDLVDVDMDINAGVWSPDGRKVAFYSEGDLWVVTVSPETGKAIGSPDRLLEMDHRWYKAPPSWSPDSEKMVFERREKDGDSDIWVVSIGDGALKQLTDGPGREGAPVWSPDGNSIAYKTDRVWLMPVEGRTPREVMSKELYYFSWSPDSQWFVYKEDKNDKNIQFFYLVDGRELDITPPEAVGKFLSWSLDGKKMLFFRSSYDHKSSLKLVSVSGGPSLELGAKLTLWAHNRHFWSPDSKMIAVPGLDESGVQNWYGLWIIPIAGGDPFPLELDVSVPGGPAPWWNPSPDCSKLLFFAYPDKEKTEEIWVAPLSMQEGRTTGPATLVFSRQHEDRYDRGRAWSPDGTRIAAVHEGRVWVAYADGREPFQLTETSGSYRRLTWSPDGKMIACSYYSEKERAIMVIPASGGKLMRILEAPLSDYAWWPYYAWSPDSEELAVVNGDEQGTVIVFPITDGKARRIAYLKDAWQAYGFHWSPDGKNLVLGIYGRILVIPAEGGEITEHAADGDWSVYLSLSPDGKWISYDSPEMVKTRPESSMWELDVSELLSGREKKQ